MRKSKKNLKGMTLYEIIIALAVFALMARILVGVGASIDRTTRSTNNLKSKIVAEKPYAANKVLTDPSGNSVATAEDMTITVNCNGANVVMEADKYNTETAFTKDETQNVDVAGKEAEANEQYNGGLNLEFVVIRPETP